MATACYDCVVIGAGPAGCTVAALTAEAGLNTLLVEREQLPRFHVGESLMPETYDTFARLGVLDTLKSSNFVKKYSVAFVGRTGKESQPFFFKDHDPRERSQTWQVERSQFDKMLFDNAVAKGATGRDQTRVVDVAFSGQRATGVVIQTSDGDKETIGAKVVVDATGLSSLLASRLGVKVVDPSLRKAAIWTYYRGATRDPGDHGGATIILHTENRKSWFWYIPLQDDITSVGVVADNDYLLKGRGAPEETFAEELARCPGLTGRLAAAEQVDKHRVAKEFSYTTSQSAGDGWVLVGDAYGFIDPIYSSGVYFALKSGEKAADRIIDAVKSNNTSGEKLGAWQSEFDAGTRWIRRLVAAYYHEQFSIGHFMKAHPQHRGNLTDLLIGRIFHERAGDIFRDMDEFMQGLSCEA
jgi:flavin-dependent dehydrogenase